MLEVIPLTAGSLHTNIPQLPNSCPEASLLGLQYGNSTSWPRHYCIASSIKSCIRGNNFNFLLLLKENCQLHNLYGHVTITVLVSNVRFKGKCCYSNYVILYGHVTITVLVSKVGKCCYSKDCIYVEMTFQFPASIVSLTLYLLALPGYSNDFENVDTALGVYKGWLPCLLPVHSYAL